MTLRRTGAIALVLAAWSLGPATAHARIALRDAAAAPACQELLAIRDEVGKHGQAIRAAGKKKAGPEQLCKLFKAFTAAEADMIKALEERKATSACPTT
jgi:hypothetical protein